MDFGKLEDISGVDFSLPEDGAETALFFEKMPKRAGPPRVFFGATGWSMPDWRGRFYPKTARPGDFLRHYGQQFSTIELNATHYKIPDSATVAAWLEAVPSDFRFCPKMPQSISHDKNLGLGTPDFAAFLRALEGLGERVGCTFLQLPPYFSVADLPALEAFLRSWPERFPLAVEARHESFFDGSNGSKIFFQLLDNQRVARCLSDVAGRRDVLRGPLTAERVLVRFMLQGDENLDRKRLENWAARVAVWLEKGLGDVFFFCHTPDNLRSPEACILALEIFKKAVPELVARAPRALPEEPRQGLLF